VAKLPRITGREMVRFLEREGFAIVRKRAQRKMTTGKKAQGNKGSVANPFLFAFLTL